MGHRQLRIARWVSVCLLLHSLQKLLSFCADNERILCPSQITHFPELPDHGPVLLPEPPLNAGLSRELGNPNAFPTTGSHPSLENFYDLGFRVCALQIQALAMSSHVLTLSYRRHSD